MARLPRLPDLLTSANLACGVLSVLLAAQGQLTAACGLVFLGALFDVFDGMAARALGGGSPLGAQLDSLADLVTFGVAPAFAVWSSYSQGLTWMADEGPIFLGPARTGGASIALLVSVIWLVVASGWRLAKFNVDTRQTSGFLGLPTPSNGMFWASIPLILHSDLVVQGPYAHALRTCFALSPWAVSALALVLGILMLSELPLPSLKFKHGGWKGNEVIFLLIGSGAVLAALYGILAVPLVLVLYLLSPLWGRLFPKPVPRP